MPKLTPFLWFDGQAEEAANFYVSLFTDARITGLTRFGSAGPGTPGSVMTVSFQLGGVEFVALNGGPQYQFTPAVSLAVNCETQPELDELWDKLTAEGQAVQCGWLTDKYGLSWQIVPAVLIKLLSDPDAVKTQRVMQAMFGMIKLDIAGLKRAYRGEEESGEAGG